MKKKIVAFFICMAMATTIVGCASSNTGATTTTTEAPTITVEKEEAAPAVETPVEEKKTDVAEAEETKEVEVVEKPAKEEEPVEETPTEEEPTEEEKSIAQTLLDGYLADGDFKEAEQYGKDLNADEVYVVGDCICYVFTNWFVQFSTSGDRPNEAYIAIGEWHNKNDATFSHVCDFGEAVAITDSMTVSKEILSYVPTVIDYMTEHPDGNTRPDIPGLNFMACEDHEPFAQH